ncbi:MAG: response regulator [Oscillospiraceae bacterium]|nr:response regulator [Oscillospiraceae bacterium]
MSSDNNLEEKIDPKKVEDFIKKTEKTLAVLGKMCSLSGWARDEDQLDLFTETIEKIRTSLESVGEAKLVKETDNLLDGARVVNYTFLAITVPDFLKRLNAAAKLQAYNAKKDSDGEDEPQDRRMAPQVDVIKGKRIMVVDDSATNRMVIFSVLSQKGAEIIQAKDGNEAVQIYKDRNGDVDLILMDLDMPELNGIDAAQQIRDCGLPKAKEVPILVLSANLDNRKFKKMDQACFNDFMSKPVMPQTLYNALTRYLRD